jgi:putative transposase
MPQSLVKVAVHVVFGTKQRKNLIPQNRLEELWAYMGGIARNQKTRLIIAVGMRDHLHMLLEMPATRNLADIVRTFKANSSRWMREANRDFGWQSGYGAFGVSSSQVRTVTEYIATQPEHHKKRTFEEEFLLLLKKAGVEYDPRYVFE